MRLAYIMSRFPSVTETFIVNEIHALEKVGAQVEVFPLVRQDLEMVHADAEAILSRARFASLCSLDVVRAQAEFCARRPGDLLRLWGRAIGGNLASAKFLLRAPIVVLKACAFARQMETLGVEHIHAHFATHAALAAYVAHGLTDIPYSMTIHAHDLYVDRTMLKEKIARARFVVTVSDYNRCMLRDLYGEDVARKTHVVRCGVDTTLFRPAECAPECFFRILCVASLQDYKGHSYLIEACARLVSAGVPLRCLLVGEGERRAVLERDIVLAGLDGVVSILGAQSRDRIRQLLAETDVFVLPSVTTETGKMEGVPVALMEALACGKPVVASAISGIPELVIHEQTGLLTPERDCEALASALKRLCDDASLRRLLGAEGRRHVLAHFDLDANARHLARLFGIAAAAPVEDGLRATPVR